MQFLEFKMKRFKDPIYGYIEIPTEIVSDVIDSPEFQRLRYIKQTSYLPVYSAALHNRFIHSLGVYHLGVKAFSAIKNNSGELLNGCVEDVGKIFQLACLLHDVGHAPFSHSGEIFYIDDTKSIYTQLKTAVDDDLFSTDMDVYHMRLQTAAPHEIMSATLSLMRFPEFFTSKEQRSFFARCITGYQYRDAIQNSVHAVYNALISLLNSSTIDVDKLDYLIRDSFVMGYNSISIDYNRLLDSATLIRVQEEQSTPIQFAFQKSALSVVENVIYAHDSEKKWIQNHPVILYEVFLIQRTLQAVRKDYQVRTGRELLSLESLFPVDGTKKNEFSDKAVTELDACISSIQSKYPTDELLEKMKCVQDNLKRLVLPINVSLLCDDDIIYLAKMSDQSFCTQLFDRQRRLHPVWKSESEYNIYVDGLIGEDMHPLLMEQIATLTSFLNEEAPEPFINQCAIDYCDNNLHSIEESALSDRNKNDMKRRYTFLLQWLHGFERIKETEGLKEFEFAVVPTSKFVSSFIKQDLGSLPIFFPRTQKSYPLKRLINLFSVNNNTRDNFFYIYYRRTDGEEETVDVARVGMAIAQLALSTSY